MSYFELAFGAILGLFACFILIIVIGYIWRTVKAIRIQSDNEPSTNPKDVHDALSTLGIHNGGITMDNQEIFHVPFESVGIK